MPKSADKVPYEIIVRSDGEFIVSVHPTSFTGQSVEAEIQGNNVLVYYSEDRLVELSTFPKLPLEKAQSDGGFLIGELSTNGIDNAYWATLKSSEGSHDC